MTSVFCYLYNDCLPSIFTHQAIGGIGPKIITTLIVWGAYPTWGSLIFYPDAVQPLWDSMSTVKPDSVTPLLATAVQNLTLACNVSPNALDVVRRFNCTLPKASHVSNATVLTDLALGKFSCNYFPFIKS